MSFELVLQLRDTAGAQALVQQVSTPGSSSYRAYITAAQWEERFSPTASEVKQARTWLQSEGFTVSGVSADRITISASGTAAQVEKAFGTGLENYKLLGQTVRFATNNLSVPASLAHVVVGAMGINENVATPDVTNGISAPRATKAEPAGKYPPAPPAFLTAKPCGAYYNAKTITVSPPFGKGYPGSVPYEVCGYQPNQFRSAYGLSSTNTGKGETVAIIDAYGSSTIVSDATKYFKTYASNLPFADAHFTQDDSFPFNYESECDASSWLVEQDIDVEAIHSMAPDAKILYVGAKNCINGLFDAEQKVIDNKLADVVTNSWGDTGGDLLDDPSTFTAYNDILMMADATGITVQFSTGDDGDNFDLLGVSAADFPASSPYDTAVGGTSLAIGSKGQQLAQYGWATGRSFLCTSNVKNTLPGCTSKTLDSWMAVTYDGGSGGFTSYNFTQPKYQAKVVPSELALRNEYIIGPSPMRVIPDISMDADPSTGLLMGVHQTLANGKSEYTLTRYGGTSLASPMLAGVIADVDQAAGTSVGFIDPAIYALTKANEGIDDILSHGALAQYRVDYASTYISGAKGKLASFREITYEGLVTYCDETGNCASRPNTLSTGPGYDSMTGIGSIGTGFVSDLAAKH